MKVNNDVSVVTNKTKVTAVLCLMYFLHPGNSQQTSTTYILARLVPYGYLQALYYQHMRVKSLLAFAGTLG